MTTLYARLLALPLLASATLVSAQDAPADAPPADPVAADPFAADAVPADAMLTTTAAPVDDATADDATDEEVEEVEDGELPNLSIGLKAGVLFPQLVNEFGTNVLVSLEIAYYLPFLDHRLAIQVEGSYAPPTVEGGQADPRIGTAGGDVSWSQRTHIASVGLGPTFRFLRPTARFVPYVSVLGRVFMEKTHMLGSAEGNSFGVNDEMSTRFGVTGALGLDLELGPGRALVEVGSGWSKLPHATTGDTTTTSLQLQLGYRLTF